MTLAAGLPTLSLLARTGAVAGAVLALVASTEAGERGNGECPAGETCSPDTPRGLLFEGAPLGRWPDLTAHGIATGGRQTYRITQPNILGPFGLPFDAAVTGDGRSVLGIGPATVVVGAEKRGFGYLRILDPSGQLYDRIELESEPIAEVQAAPTYVEAYPVLLPDRWAAFARGEASVALDLVGVSGAAIVDEDLVMRTPVPSRRTSWDTFALTTAGAGTILLTVDAGELTGREVRVPVVDSFDELVVTGPRETGVGGDIDVCFPAWQRSATTGNTLVIGVRRQFRVTGPATPLATQEYPSCVQLHTDAPGTVLVDATVGARTWTATIEVRGGGAREATGFGAWLRAPSDGERASMIDE